MAEIIYLTKLQVQGQFLALIIVKAIIIVFYKATRNVGLAFNPATTDFLNLFVQGCWLYIYHDTLWYERLPE